MKEKEALLNKVKKNRRELRSSLRNILNKAKEMREIEAFIAVKEIHSIINRGFFDYVIGVLHLILDTEFILYQKELSEKIEGLIEAINREFVQKITRIARNYRAEGQRAPDNFFEKHILDDLPIRSNSIVSLVKVTSELKGAKNRFISNIKKAFDMHLVFFMSHSSLESLKDDIDKLKGRLLCKLPFQGGDKCETSIYTEARERELKDIEKKIISLCELSKHLLVAKEKYKKEEGRKEIAEQFNLWAMYFKDALVNLKKAHMSGVSPKFYRDESEAVAKMLSSWHLAKCLFEEESFSDGIYEEAFMHGRRVLLLTCSLIAVDFSCYASRRFNIMPGKNPLLMIDIEHEKALLALAGSALLSYSLVCTAVKCLLPAKRMYDTLSKYESMRGGFCVK